MKTGKQLDGKARLANFAKSWGNAFVAGGVVLGSLGYTIGEVIGNIFHNADEVKGAGSSVAQETMQRVHEKVVAGGKTGGLAECFEKLRVAVNYKNNS